MPNVVTIPVENPDEILNAGAYAAGAIVRVQTSATEAGAFADVAGTGATPTIAIVTGTRSYTGYDPAGVSSSWYRTRYENVGGTRLSDWTPAFQAGDETGGLICSVYDVEQRLGQSLSPNERELLLDIIREVTADIEGYTGRWFVPRPLNGATTYRLNTQYGVRLRLPKGIRSVTTLNVASSDQPATGGTYTAIASTGFVIEPSTIERDNGWPGTSIRLLISAGSCFFNAINGAEIVGAFGWDAVPMDIQGVGVEASIRKWIGKERAEPAAFVGPAGVSFLREVGPHSAAILERYRVIPVG